MPNHITNKLTIIGDQEQVKNLIDKYSTFHEKKPHESHDGKLTYQKSGELYSFGWLDKETNIFSRRDQDPVIGVPEGYEQHFVDEWTSMPDFNKVIPQPENIFKGDLGRKEEEECKANGIPTWYEWNIENWGTKWDGYSFKKTSDNEFFFDTAWSGVPKIIHAISIAFPNVELVYKYASEDTGSNTGYLRYKNGKETLRSIPESQSKEAYDIVFELMPDRKEDMELVDGVWEYKED